MNQLRFIIAGNRRGGGQMINSIIAMTVFILVLSYAIGKIVSMKLNLSEKLPYAIPLGFFIILGLHQIITLPVMIWHLSSQVLVILTVILGIVLSGYALFKIKLWYRIREFLTQI